MFNIKYLVAETERKRKIKEAHIQGVDPPPKRKNIIPPNTKLKKIESSSLPGQLVPCGTPTSPSTNTDDDDTQLAQHETSTSPSSNTNDNTQETLTSEPLQSASISSTLNAKSVLTEIEANNIQLQEDAKKPGM